MNREQLEEIRSLYEGWRVGVTCCPQEGSPCTKCAERAAATAERVPELLDEIDRQAQELSANERSEDARVVVLEAEIGRLKERIDKAVDPLVVAVLDAAIVLAEDLRCTVALAEEPLSEAERAHLVAVDAMLAARHTLRDTPTGGGS